MREFFIIGPTETNKRKSFMVVERYKDAAGKKKSKSIKDKRIDAINEAVKTRTHDLWYLRDQLKTLVVEYRKNRIPQSPHVNNPENLKIFDKFWKEEYEHRRIEDQGSARNEFLRAIKALDNLSLMTATSNDIQRKLNSKFKGDAQRRLVSATRTLLKFLNRTDVKLQLDNKDYPEISHLSEQDFLKILRFMQPIDALLCKAGFYSQLRIGELFALEPSCYIGSNVRVNWQLAVHKVTKKVIRKLPKRGKRRTAYVAPKGREAIEKWCAVPMDWKWANRKRDWTWVVRNAAITAFPDIESKHICMHDIRHSGAIYLLAEGATMPQLAQSLGNGEKVCQDNYTGYSTTQSTSDALDALFAKKEKK